MVYELTTIGYCYEPIVVHASTNTGRPADLYEVVAPRREKSCGRVADKFGLRTWTINLRTWIFEFTCLVFKTTCIDRGKPLREGAFFFTRTMLFPPLNKRNTCDKARSLYITSEGISGSWAHDALAQYLESRTLPQPSHIGQLADQYRLLCPHP